MAKTPTDYKKLKAIWYKKLQKQGFKDIENESGYLKTWSSYFGEKRVNDRRELREPYYDMATIFLNEYEFKTNLDKIIWGHHARGEDIRSIAIIVTKARHKKISFQNVFVIVKRLAVEMKKMYLPSYQDNE